MLLNITPELKRKYPGLEVYEFEVNNVNVVKERLDLEKFKEIIVDRLGADPNEITDDASFVDDLGADSLDTVELVMAF